MQYENGFEIFIAVVFSIIPKLGGLGHKSKYLVIPFRLGKGETIPHFHLGALVIRLFMRYQTGNINNLTGKYIMELSNMKHLQRYMTSFEIEFRRFERKPQSNQLSIIFTPSMEVIFETL